MPGFDGTGPRGMGPMTGGGRGFCNPYSPAYGMGYGFPMPHRGFGRGPGRGFGGGRGRAGQGGRGWRNWFYATGLPGWLRTGYGLPAFGMGPYAPMNYGQPFAPQMDPQDELEMLNEQQDILKQNLEEINKRISELEKANSNKKEKR